MLTSPHSLSMGLGALVLALAPFAAAQQTLLVGPNGPFTNIRSAIQAASPGDTVLVAAGNYQENLTIDKGIKLVGSGARLSLAPFIMPMAVRDLPAGQTFTMLGFDAGQSTSLGQSDMQINVVDCAGSVVLRNLGPSGLDRWTVNATNSAQVHIGVVALRKAAATDSNCVFESCVFDPTIAAGLRVAGGRVAVVACTVNGSVTLFNGPGIQLDGGQLALTRSTVRAGAGVVPFSAVESTSGLILLDPSSTLHPASGQPAVDGPALFETFEFGSLTAVSDGQNLLLDVHGPAGSAFATLLSFPSAQTVTQYGIAWIDPMGYLFVNGAVLGSSRLHSSTVPHVPLPPGFTVAMQTVYVSSTGLSLGTPSLVATP